MTGLQTGKLPPLEEEKNNGEISQPNKMYNDLKLKQEQDLNDMKAKLLALKKKCGKPLEKETVKVEDKTGNELGETKKNADNKEQFLFNSSVLKREFKILVQIGKPGQTQKLTFVSL